MKKVIISVFFILFILAVRAQDEVKVSVKGVGPTRVEAINDARREAVGKAYGVSIQSQTEVKDFIAIRDAISTQSSGWITWDTITQETKLRDTYEVIMTAKVSKRVLDKDIKTLGQWLGGLQFLVFFDPRQLPKKEISVYQYAYDRFNEKLKNKEYRYVEKMNYETLSSTEEDKALAGQKSEYSYVQKLGSSVKSEFIIFIDKIEIRNLGKEGYAPGYKVTISTRAYDNCTAEGFAPKVMEGQSVIADSATAVRFAIDEAINKYSESLFYEFNKYMGNWLSEGAVFEIRFYNFTYEELRELRNKIKADKAFGQQLTVNTETNYVKWNLTFNKKPDELTDFILDNAANVSVSNIYGRLLMFKKK